MGKIIFNFDLICTQKNENTILKNKIRNAQNKHMFTTYHYKASQIEESSCKTK